MKTDTLSRRLRFAPPQPLAKAIVLTESDIDIFHAIHTHGPLPTNYLYRFSGKTSYKEFQHRLTRLFNGGKDGPGYLTRPWQQFNSFYARYQPIIYDLSPRAIEELKDRGLWSEYLKRTDGFLHRFMGACISASVDLECRKRHYTFIPTHEIFDSRECRRKELSLPLSNGNAKQIEPDNLFGIRFPDGKTRYCIIEIDRNTESVKRSVSDQNSFAKKIHAYLEVLRADQHAKLWGIKPVRILTVTTNAAHMENIIRYLAEQPDPIRNRFLFQAYSTFGKQWAVPRGTLAGLLDEPWYGTAEPVSLIR